MRGIDVRKKLQNNGFSLKIVAELMGETPQNLNSMLNARDIKTGVLERIAKVINKSLYFFFDDKVGLMTKEEMQQHDKEVAKVNGNCKLCIEKERLIKAKDEHIKDLQKQIQLLEDIKKLSDMNVEDAACVAAG
jgi:transcriptional regulator with XRE-family HTH domain